MSIYQSDADILGLQEVGAAAFVGDLIQYGRQPKLVEVSDVIRDNARHDADGVTLLKYVDAETAKPLYAITKIDLKYLLKMLLLSVRHHRECHFKRFVLIQLRNTGQRLEFAVDPDDRGRSGAQVQVGRAKAHCHSQKIIDSI